MPTHPPPTDPPRLPVHLTDAVAPDTVQPKGKP